MPGSNVRGGRDCARTAWAMTAQISATTAHITPMPAFPGFGKMLLAANESSEARKLTQEMSLAAAPVGSRAIR